MIDFSKATEELNGYKGSEKKKTLIYNNKRYLVKFPDPIREKNKECNKAIYRVFKRINIEEINKFIDEISCISEVRRDFYKKIIELRYEIIKDVYNAINSFN